MELEQNYSGLSGPRLSNANDASTASSNARNAEASSNADRAANDEAAVQNSARAKDFENYLNQNLDKHQAAEKDERKSGTIKDADIAVAALQTPLALPATQAVRAPNIDIPDNNMLAPGGLTKSEIPSAGLTGLFSPGEMNQNKIEPLHSNIIPGAVLKPAQTDGSIPEAKDSEVIKIAPAAIATLVKITPSSGLKSALEIEKQTLAANAGTDVAGSEAHQQPVPMPVAFDTPDNAARPASPLVEAVPAGNNGQPDYAAQTGAAPAQLSPHSGNSGSNSIGNKTPVTGVDASGPLLQTQSSNKDAPVPLTLSAMPPMNDLSTGAEHKAAPEGTAVTPVSQQPGTEATPLINPLLPDVSPLTAELPDQANKPLTQTSGRFSGRRSHEFAADASRTAPQSHAPVIQNHNNASAQQAQPDGQSFLQTLTQNPGGPAMAPEVKGQDAGAGTATAQTGNVIYIDKTGAPRTDATTPAVHNEGRSHPVSPPIREIAMHISQHADNGVNRFQLRLDPPDLGRVDVRMEISSEGKLSAIIAVERPETLDLLQRDSRQLERSLLDAGLKTDGNSLSFSLKGGRQDNFQSGFSDPRVPGQGLIPLGEWDEPLTPLNARFANRAVNIRI